jgi:hypothetical protein
MNELSSTARIVRVNRMALSLIWGSFGVACLAPLVRPNMWSAKTALVLSAIALAFLLAAWGFYRGTRWGRFGIGVLMAFLALYCFDQLLVWSFSRPRPDIGRVALCCALLAAAFYTWLFLFSGLDRGGPMRADSDTEGG